MVNVPLSPSDYLSLGCLIARSHNKCMRLYGCNVSFNCIKSFKQGLGESPDFGCLEIGSSLDEQTIKVLSELIINNSNFHTLVIICCNLKYNGLLYILSSLESSCPLLRTLVLLASNVQVNEENGPVLKDFIIKKPTLETLDLSYNQLMGDIGAHYIGPTLMFIRTLNLSGCGITIKGLLPLCENLEKNTSLTNLYLTDNNICDDGIEHLSQSLAFNCTLTTLGIERCGFTECGIKSLAMMLFHNKTITMILWDRYVMINKESLEQIGPRVAAVLFPNEDCI